MNVADLYLKLFLLVVLPLLAGMGFSGKPYARPLATRLFAIALYLFHTLVVFLAVWKAQLANNAWMLPFIVLAGWLVSLAVAWLSQPLMRHTPTERGSFLFTVCLSNHGYTLLGIIALIVFGESGLAQATYAQFLITPFLILVCFPIARHFGAGQGAGGIGQMLKENIADKRNLPLVAMLGGLALNLSGVERPAVFSDATRIAVYLGTLVSGVAIGLLFRASHILRFKKENLFSLVYRSTLYPLFFLAAARLFNLGQLDSFILLLFGIAPSAVFSNLIADLFKLDRDLANSVYIVSTTIFLVLVLPVYLFVVGTVSLLG